MEKTGEKGKLSFNIFFDGTGNNLSEDIGKGTHTNVARLFNAVDTKKTDLTNQDYSAKKSGAVQSESIYLNGVGSSKGRFHLDWFNEVKQGIGLGSQRRVDKAYDALVSYLNKQPEQVGKVDINVCGFSRGAAQARHFTNVVNKRGVPEIVNGKKTGNYLVEPQKVNLNKLVIFDTVASYGIPKSFIDKVKNYVGKIPGVRQLPDPITKRMSDHMSKDLKIHENVDSTLHLIAAHEFRKTFPITLAAGGKEVKEEMYPGAHSQVGGGYAKDIVAAGPYNRAYNEFANVVSMKPMETEDVVRLHEYNQFIQKPEQHAQIIDSRIKKDDLGEYTEKFIGEVKQKTAFQEQADSRRPINENIPVKQIEEELKSAVHLDQMDLDKLFLESAKSQRAEDIEKQINKANDVKQSLRDFNFKPERVAPENTLSSCFNRTFNALNDNLQQQKERLEDALNKALVEQQNKNHILKEAKPGIFSLPSSKAKHQENLTKGQVQESRLAVRLHRVKQVNPEFSARRKVAKQYPALYTAYQELRDKVLKKNIKQGMEIAHEAKRDRSNRRPMNI